MSSIHHQHHNEECPSCGTIYKGKFCYNCGEKVFHPSDLGMKKFMSQTVDIFTHFDSKFIRSVKYLLFYPGYLAKAYTTGARVKFAKPMQVFVLANLFFYFLTHLTHARDYSPGIGDEQYNGISSYFLFQWASGFDQLIRNTISQITEWKQAQLGLNNDEFIKVFDENSWIYSKSFVIILIPLFGLVFWGFFAKRFKYFGGALVFAVYFVSFQIITYAIISIFYWGFHMNILQPIRWLFFKTPVNYLTQLFITGPFELDNLIIWVPYLFIGIQRISKKNIWFTLASSFLLAKILYFITFGFYKKLLIVLTLFMMHHI